MFFKVGVLKNFAKFTGKQRVLESSFNKAAGLESDCFMKEDTSAQIFIFLFFRYFLRKTSWQLIPCKTNQTKQYMTRWLLQAYVSVMFMNSVVAR